MSKEEWFKHFEQCEAEHPELSDEELSDMAMERLKNQMADQADWESEVDARNRAKDRVKDSVEWPEVETENGS